MAEIVSNSESEAVILDGASPIKKQVNARIHWFFTFNNYNSEDIAIILKVLEELCYMYCFQEETGECGTPHLQGILSLKKRARWTEFGLMKTIHWEKPNNLKDCYLYCSKVETRTGDVFVKNYELPYKFELTELSDWQTNLMAVYHSKPDDRTVYWIWSSKGKVGKSQMAKHLCANCQAVLLTKGKYTDICNLIYKSKMTVSKLVVFDLPRNNGNKISYDAVESIKNGMIANMKYETGFIMFPPPHIFIFANAPPNEECLSSDRWKIICLDEE